MLILIAGLPGTGKTTIANAFAQKYGAVHLNSDQLRKELGLWGSYRPEDKQRVYEELLSRTKKALALGQTVVVDSTFYRADLRRPFMELVENQTDIAWVLATAPDDILRERVSKPRPDSEAGEAVLDKIEAQFEPLEVPFLEIETVGNSPEALAEIIHNHIHNG